MNTQPYLASHYRGRITVTLEEKSGKRKKDGTQRPQKNRVVDIKPMKPMKLRLMDYTLKVSVSEACNLPKTKVFGARNCKEVFSIRFSIANTFVQTDEQQPSRTMRCDFSSSGVLQRNFKASPDAMQMPDLIVTLMKGSGRKSLPIAFTRVASVSLLEGTQLENDADAGEPRWKWLHMKEDKAIDALRDDIFAGNILVKIGLYKNKKAAAPSQMEDLVLAECSEALCEKEEDGSGVVPFWTEEMSDPGGTGESKDGVNAKVTINLLCARNFPPWDLDTGALDAYCKITLDGQTLLSSVKPNTRNPAWFERLEFSSAVLNRDRSKRPEIVMQFFDRDEGFGEKDDFVGNCIVKINEDDGAPPSWRQIFYQEPGDIRCGEVLVGVEVAEEDVVSVTSSTKERGVARIKPTVPLPKFEIECKRVTIEIVSLSCRNLQALSAFHKLARIFVEMSIGGRTIRTQPSSKPSAACCNFSETHVLEDFLLPVKLEHAPYLDVSVYDKSLVGKTLLGTGSFWIGDIDFYNEERAKVSGAGERRRRETRSGSNCDQDDPAALLDNNFLYEPHWMNGRSALLGPWVCQPYFSKIPLVRGKKMSNPSSTQKYELEEIGSFNLFARAIAGEDAKNEDEINSRKDDVVKAMTEKKKFRVRVYILEAADLTAKDGKTSDPFVRVTLGNSRFESKRKKKTLSPEFYERFDFIYNSSGESILKVEVMDHDHFGASDLIGRTVIDLEQRMMSAEWQQTDVKPVETRDLMSETSSQSQGTLKLFVDVVPLQEEKSHEAFDISPPPPHDFELRMVVWKCEGIPSGGDLGGNSDLFVKMRLGNGPWRSTDVHYFAKNGKASWNFRLKFPIKLLHGGRTADGGEASRTLKIQVWDLDILVSDCLAETSVDLSEAFKTSYNTRDLCLGYQVFGESSKQLKLAAKRKVLEAKESEYVMKKIKDEEFNEAANERTSLLGEGTMGGGMRHDDDARDLEAGGYANSKGNKKKKQAAPRKKRTEKKGMIERLRHTLGFAAPEDSAWIKFSKTNLKTGEMEYRGKLLLRIEILPVELAVRRKCGEGQEEPNAFPVLPPPEGRVDFRKMMLNPLYALQTLLGDSLAKECGAGCCCILFLAAFLLAGIVLGPEIQILLSVLSVVPTVVAQWILIGLAACSGCCCFYVCCCFCRKDEAQDWEEDAEDH